MDLKHYLILLISIILGCHAEGESLECVFEDRAFDGYTCILNISNPNGFDNFTSITGKHLSRKTNMDVRYVKTTDDSQTSNIPSIICETFRFLSEINFEDRKLSELGANSFKHCNYLSIIRLSKNFITKIAENTFEPVRRLKQLRLDENYLEELPRGMLRPLENLETLNLYKNYLNVIHTDIFGLHPSLQNIILSYNHIDALSPAIFDSTPGLNSLNLQNNICTNALVLGGIPIEQKKEKVQECLDNYENYPTNPIPPPGSCNQRNLFERVCELETLSDQYGDAIEEMRIVIEKLSEEVQRLKNQK